MFQYSKQPILFFDSNCVLCSRVITFILRHEKNKTLKFASLQGEVFQALKENYDIPLGVDSTILYEEGEIFIESRAALKLCKYLKTPYSFLVIFKIFPSFISDRVYKWIARNRYDWFGTCEFIPETASRYLQ